MPRVLPLRQHRSLPGILPVLCCLASLPILAHLLVDTRVGERKAAGRGTRGQPRDTRTLILLDVNIRSSVRTVSENFLSIQLDPAVVHNGWIDFLSSKRLVTLARGLAPAFLWFGGKRTDFLQFQNHRNLAKHRGELGPDYYLKNYEDDIVRSDIALDKQKGCKIAQHPDIMLELQREKASQVQLALTKEQFSNTYSNITITEPNSYRTMVGRTINGSQLGKDYIQFKNLLQSVRFYTKASLYGPNIGRPRRNTAALLDGYYIDDQTANVADFMKTRLLDTLSDQIAKVHRVVNSHVPGKKVWLGGVGPAWAGGTTNLSDTYAAGFLWLNTLGMSAKQGIDVVIRNSFFDHGYNHLVDQNFNPLPDYWLSLLYKRLVGTKVLTVQVAGLQRKPRPGRVIRDKLRIYAHCTHIRNHNYLRGSITIYIINLHRSRKKIKLAGTLRDKTVHQYLLQPYGVQGLQAKSVQLNGRPLLMVDDETFPELKPRTLRAGRIVVIPPLSIGFYVVKNANAPSCKFR
ncbi:inactive heparanase-2 [Rhincodon typus]|uniref:inactive heparanase-2 n=1 Tax=Rhincodon typus TaxID=259920 RepID=UPI00202E005E|nr:inactive heparanase-2 [Rhincodon typus]